MFKKHEVSGCHREAVDVVITLPHTTRDIGEQLSLQHAKEKESNRTAFLKILKSIQYLARQGLPLRGAGDDSNGNFVQLLNLMSEGSLMMKDWLKRKTNTYTSHNIQNEIINLMAKQVLKEINVHLQQSPFLTLMLDETTDVSNKEQVVVVLRWVSSDLIVSEKFLGLHEAPSTDALTLTTIAKNAMQGLGLPLAKLRGQCYDGASCMKGEKSGVAQRIREEEPRAVYTHCYGHSINLATCDAVKESKPIKNALEMTHEVCKLIKCSPKRENIFRRLKEASNLTTDYCSFSSIRVLCPTRWTVRANALASIIENYVVLQDTWDEALEVAKDTDSKAKINGVSAQMKKFEFLFSTILGEMLLRHCDNLSQTLQSKTMSAAEGQKVGKMVIDTLQSIRNDESYELFWEKVLKSADSLDVDEAQLPRKCKTPRRYDDGESSGDFANSPKSYYRQVYYEATDCIINCLKNRFDQPGYKIYSQLEELLIKASMGEDFGSSFKYVCDFYKDDFESHNLHAQLLTFKVNFQDVYKNKYDTKCLPTIFDIKNYFQELSSAQRILLSQVCWLLQLVLVMPATNATSERSFSALCRVKSYLRSTMGQERLSNLLMLHVHKDLTDSLDLLEVANSFVSDSEHRLKIFGKFA